MICVIVGGVAGGLALLVLWSCLVVAARADKAMERMMADWEKPEISRET